MPRPIESGPRIVNVHTVEGCCEAIGVAFTAHFPIGDDVEAGTFLISNGKDCGVILSFLEELIVDPP